MNNNFIIKADITSILHNHRCSYNDTQEILSGLLEHYKTLREQTEYNTIQDCIDGIKTRDVGSDVVPALSDVVDVLMMSC